MKNLCRALRMALRYRWSITISIAASILVALMWGANLGAVYPFVEVVLNNRTLSDWAEDRIDDADRRMEAMESRAAAIALEIPQADDARRQALQRELRSVDSEREIYRLRAESCRTWLPTIQRWTPNDPFQTLTLIVAALLIATFLKSVFLMINMVLIARVGQRTILDLQNEVFRNVLRMELSEVGVKGTGDLINRIRGETNAIGGAVIHLYGKTLREPLKMAACLVGAAWINWRLTVFSLLICPAAIVLLVMLARAIKRANRRAMEESAKLVNRLYQALTYLRVVKAFTMESHEQQRFQSVAQDVYGRAMKISFYTSLARINNELLGVSIIGLAVLAGGYLVINQETHLLGIRLSAAPMSFGEVIVFFAFLCGVADPLRKMGDFFGTLQTGMVAADRVFPLIDQQPAVTGPQPGVQLPEGPPSIEFSDIWFGYEPERPVLRGVNFRVAAGSSLAVIGPNGCGKSTLINLLLRFFDPVQGQVLVGGHDVRELALDQWRGRLGFVTQLTMLFNETVENNVKYGSPAASVAEVQAAARRAQAHEFIAELQDGYQTDIGEHGGKLSGGQRQRLALARAILRNPSVLILDEATSQIDPHSEAAIHQAMKQFIKGRTTIMITHRLSTLELADQIMVMDGGQVVDIGTHEDLLHRCPAYRQLRDSEMKGMAA